MHGTYGEDGSLMGLFEMAGVPYIGCGQAASVLAMDKVLSKLMAEAHHLLTPRFTYYDRNTVTLELDKTVADVIASLKFPLFVKPAHLGSSIGISRVTDTTGLRNGLEVAAHYDDKIIVEEAVNNLVEVTLPVMGNADPVPALLERPVMQDENFFDFQTKYMQGGKKGKGKGNGKSGTANAQGYSQLPAELPENLYRNAEQLGLAMYKALGCEGIARIDMLIDTKAGQVYFNEVNPLPGSLYAHNWRAAGVAGVDLVKRLVEYAEERFQRQQQITTSFDTSYLKQF
jgi:D-alanine-D-alanine ligase